MSGGWSRSAEMAYRKAVRRHRRREMTQDILCALLLGGLLVAFGFSLAMAVSGG